MGNYFQSALIVVVLLSAVNAPAQHYTFKHYGEERGLGNPDVTAIAQDRAGYLWVGVENGVYRYDGSRFQQFGQEQGLTDPTVLALYVDSRDVVWVGTETGLFYLEQGRFHELTVDGRSLEFIGESSMATLPSGQFLAGTRSGLYIVDRFRDHWLAVPFSSKHPGYRQSLRVRGMLVDGEDRLWMGCDKGICEYSSGRLSFYGPKDGVPEDIYLSLARDAVGKLWARGRAHMLGRASGDTAFREDAAVCVAKACDTNAGLFGRDRQNRLLTPLNSGLRRWDGVRWEKFGQAQGLPNAAVASVLVDRDGIVWIGTQGSALFKWLGYGEWEHWGVGEGMKDPIVYGIDKDHQDRMWTVSLGDVMRSDRLHRKFERYVPKSGARFQGAESVLTAFDGTVWLVGKHGELWHLWPESGKVEQTHMATGVFQVLSDWKDRIWIACGAGILVEEKIGNSWFAHEEGGAIFHGRLIRAIAQGPDHTMWAGSTEGLFHQTNGVWQRVQLDGLGKYVANIAVTADGAVWISGQFSGVARLRIEQDKVKTLERLQNNGTHVDLVMGLTVDARDRVWVATDHGLDLLQSGKWRHYDTGEGMASNDTDEKASYVDSDGSIWIGTTAGLSHFTVPELQSNAVPPLTTITQASWAGLPIPLDRAERFPWRSRDLSVSFSVLSFRNEEAISFRYRLVGLEEEWVSTSERSVRYAKLPPGHYRFEVISEDSGSHLSSPPASFSFQIAPPWWRTWEFFACIALLLAGLVVAMWRFRIRNLLATKMKLEAIVAERTRTLEEERVLLLIARDALKQQATHDSLTGLLNRRAIFDALTREWQRASREHLSLLVVIADLDHFKHINDTYGHPAGDTVLIQVASCLEANIREYDALGRYGGEEFLLVLTGCEEGKWDAQLNRIRESIARERILLGAIEVSVSCSFGAAGFAANQEPFRLQDLLAAADRALYRAKANGRNRVEFESCL